MGGSYKTFSSKAERLMREKRCEAAVVGLVTNVDDQVVLSAQAAVRYLTN